VGGRAFDTLSKPLIQAGARSGVVGPRRNLLAPLTAALLASLAFAPLAVAADPTGCGDALTVRTDRASYPPQAPVRITLTNQGNVSVALSDAHVEVWTGTSSVHRVPLNNTALAPGDSVTVVWNTTQDGAATPGTYDGVMFGSAHFDSRLTNDSCLVRLNEGKGFVLLAQASPPPTPAEPPRTLMVQAGSGTWTRGEPVSFTLTNAANTTLTEDGCGARFAILDKVGALVFDSRAGQQACPAVVLSLSPGQPTSTTWNGLDAQGKPVAAGTYAVQAMFGDAAGMAWFAIRESGTAAAQGSPLLRLDAAAPAPGDAVVARLTNIGATAAQGLLHFEVRSADGALQHTDERVVALAAGGSVTLNWTPSARDAGAFALRALLAGAEATTDVTVTAAPSSGATAPTSSGSLLAPLEATLEARDGTVAAKPSADAAPLLRVRVVRADASEVTLELDVAQHEGRTLVFHLDEPLAARLAQGLEVRFDGAPARQASGLGDVLDPSDDGNAAEWWLVHDGDGAAVLLSVPHFSVHTVSFSARLAEVLPSLAPYGAVGAMGVLLVAAAVLVRRGRER